MCIYTWRFRGKGNSLDRLTGCGRAAQQCLSPDGKAENPWIVPLPDVSVIPIWSWSPGGFWKGCSSSVYIGILKKFSQRWRIASAAGMMNLPVSEGKRKNQKFLSSKPFNVGCHQNVGSWLRVGLPPQIAQPEIYLKCMPSNLNVLIPDIIKLTTRISLEEKRLLQGHIGRKGQRCSDSRACAFNQHNVFSSPSENDGGDHEITSTGLQTV